MKNKKLMYVLLPVVVGVWGIIIYRIVDSMTDNAAAAVEMAPISDPIQKETVKYDLALNYPDPFLGKSKVVSSRQKKATRKSTKPKKRTVKKVAIKKPVIRYNGAVENRKSNEARHLISIDGRSHIVTLGQDVGGVILKKVFTDSVQFNWNKETISVRK